MKCRYVEPGPDVLESVEAGSNSPATFIEECRPYKDAEESAGWVLNVVPSTSDDKSEMRLTKSHIVRAKQRKRSGSHVVTFILMYTKRHSMHMNNSQRERHCASSAHAISCQKPSPTRVPGRSVANPCQMNSEEVAPPGRPSLDSSRLSRDRVSVVLLAGSGSSLLQSLEAHSCLTEDRSSRCLSSSSARRCLSVAFQDGCAP